MLMTEAEAKNIWCPQTSREWGIKDSRFTLTPPNVKNCCLGSRCGAWRWSESETLAGYCGLGGRVRRSGSPTPRISQTTKGQNQ